MPYLEPFPNEIFIVERHNGTVMTQSPLSDLQITVLEDIWEGRKYCKVFANGRCVILTVIRGPYQANGVWYFDAHTHTALSERFSLADCGIVPYPTGRWNNRNFLVAAP